MITRHFVITGSVVQVARLIAATHTPEDLNITEGPDDTDVEEAPDGVASESDGDGDAEIHASADKALLVLKKKLSALLTISFRCLGPIPSPLDSTGIEAEDVNQISIDFTYNAAARIRLPKSPQDHTFVSISANIGTLITATKKCTATLLCPRGEGHKQIRALLEASGVTIAETRVQSCYVDNVPHVTQILHEVLGDQVEVFADRFHIFRLLTAGIKVNDPDRGRLLSSLRSINQDISTKQITTVPQLRDAIRKVCDTFSKERTRHVMNVPKSKKITAALCCDLLNASSSDEAKTALKNHGALELLPACLNAEVAARWKRLYEDDAAIRAIIGDPTSMLPGGTNANENLHGFLNGRLRGYRTMGYDLFHIALQLAREIWNVTGKYPHLDRIMYMSRTWHKKVSSDSFWVQWRKFQEKPPQPTTLASLNTAAQFKVVCGGPWPAEELVILEDHIMAFRSAPPQPGVSIIETLLLKFPTRTAADVSRRVQLLLNQKIGSLSHEPAPEPAPSQSQAGRRRERSNSAPPRRSGRDCVLAVISDIPYEHLDAGTGPTDAPVNSLVIVTVRQGRTRSTGIGLVHAVDARGVPSSVDYYRIDGEKVPSGGPKRSMVPPVNWELVGIRIIPRPVPLE